MAQAAAPEARVVYVDNDPIVLLHARELLTSTNEGATAYIRGRSCTTAATSWRKPTATLDFSQPVAVMLLAILQFISDAADPYPIVAALMDDGGQPGSYLVLSHPASDIQAEAMARMARGLNKRQRGNEQVRFRNRGRGSPVLRRAWTWSSPGVVQPHRWRPDEGTFAPVTT